MPPPLHRWSWGATASSQSGSRMVAAMGLGPRAPLRPRRLGSQSAAEGPAFLSLIPNFVAFAV